MDFALSEEQQAIFDMARDFGAEHIAPYAEEWEAQGTIPKALWAKVAELGANRVAAFFCEPKSLSVSSTAVLSRISVTRAYRLGSPGASKYTNWLIIICATDGLLTR